MVPPTLPRILQSSSTTIAPPPLLISKASRPILYPSQFRCPKAMRLHHTAPPYPPQSGYITLLTPLRTHRRFLQITNTHLIYGHRSDKILFTTDLSKCELSITGTHLKLRLSGRRLVFSLSRPEMQVWYPLFAAGTANLERFYSLGARVCTMRGGAVFAGCDRGDGAGVRVWRVPAGMGWGTPGLRIRCEGVVEVRDLFVGCDEVHVVFEEFGGYRICDLEEGDAMRSIVRDILGALCVLHGRGLVHGNVEEGTFVRDGRGAVVLFGFVEQGQPGRDLSDVARIMERLCNACKSVHRVVAMLRAGVPALEVLKDEWFAGVDNCEERERCEGREERGSFSKEKGSYEVESPRSVLLPSIADINP